MARAAEAGGGRVAALGALDERLVLRDRAAARQLPVAEVLDAVQPRVQTRQHPRDLRVAARVDEDLVEGLVGAVGLAAVAFAQRGDERLVVHPQLAHLRRPEPRHGELRREAVHRREQRDDLVHVAHAQAGHAGEPLRRHVDEALVAQPAQRVAHRRAAEPEPLAQLARRAASSPGASVPSTIASHRRS